MSVSKPPISDLHTPMPKFTKFCLFPPLALGKRGEKAQEPRKFCKSTLHHENAQESRVSLAGMSSLNSIRLADCEKVLGQVRMFTRPLMVPLSALLCPQFHAK